MPDQDPFAAIASPIASSGAMPPAMQTATDPFAAIAKPVSAISSVPAKPPASQAPAQPSVWDTLTQPTEKTDKEYLGYTGPAGVAGATIHGLNKVAEGTKGALKGAWDMFAAPKDNTELGIAAMSPAALPLHRTLQSLGHSAADATKIVGAIHDIDQSSDPTGSYLNAAEDTAAQGAGQALTAVAGEGLMKSIHPAAREPIPGAPLTSGEAAGAGLKQGAEKLLSRMGTSQNRMQDVMSNRTAAMTDAAAKVSPEAGTPETTGAAVQGAARDVLQRQGEAQGLVKDLANRAQDEAETTRVAATETAGREAQASATRDLDARRSADIQSGKQTAKDISGRDELPVPEADRQIITSLRGANDAAKGEESAAHNQLTKAAKDRGIVVDTKPMQDVAKSVVQLEGPARDLITSSIPASVLKMLERASEGEAANSPLDPYAEAMTGHNYVELKSLAESPPSGKEITRGAGGTNWKDALQRVETEAAKQGVQPLEAGVPYDIMKTGRTAVRESLQGARKHFQQTGMGGNAVRVQQELYGSMSDAMKKSLEPHPDLTKQFNEANALTVDRKATFVDPKFIRRMVLSDDPAKVIGAVMRSGNEADIADLRTALDADKTGEGLATAQRGAMDYVLRKSTKVTSGSSDLPASVRPEAIDYDLAHRNAQSSPALKTLLGEEKYTKFVKDLDSKRMAQRSPQEMALDDQLQKIAKAETSEKAAKVAGVDVTKNSAVVAAERRATGARSASQRMETPSVTEKGTQKVADTAANELEPSKLVERAGNSQEYTDKLLEVIDKHPQATQLRAQLGQRIFRNASDNAMVQGAFGSTDGIFDVGKFQSEFSKVRPSLERILPEENLKAMDDFTQSLNDYALSKGIGGGAGMMGRMFAIRQLFGLVTMAKGALAASPLTFAGGAAISYGPKLWMELATRPGLARAASAIIKKSVGTAAIAGGITGDQERDRDLRDRDLGQGQPGTSRLVSATSSTANQSTNITQPHSGTPITTSAPDSTTPFAVPQGAEKFKPQNDTSILRDPRTKQIHARAVRDANGKLAWGPPK